RDHALGPALTPSAAHLGRDAERERQAVSRHGEGVAMTFVGQVRMASIRWALGLVALAGAAGVPSCGGEEVIIKTADGVELTAADIDNNPLALMPGGSVGVFNVDMQALWASPSGNRWLQLVGSRLPVPPSANFDPERDLSRLYVGLY